MEKSIMHSFSESSAPLVKTTPLLLPGELIDEQDEQHPELYAVPITPPNLSISGKDIGLRPMSLEDFRKKIKSFQNSERWNEFKTDEGVIENERADILADRINELLSNKKQKFMYEYSHSDVSVQIQGVSKVYHASFSRYSPVAYQNAPCDR